MRETVKREADGLSVSYGSHFSLNPAEGGYDFASVNAARACLEVGDGCTMIAGASGCVRRVGKKLSLGSYASADDI